MRHRSMLFTLCIIMMLALVAASFAQDKNIIVAASSSSDTYMNMMQEIKEVCSDEITITVLPKHGGATENLEALVHNQASAAFVHSDVIISAADAEASYRNYKTLIALYPEELHVLALRTSKTMIGRVFKAAVEFNSLSDLSGYSVGAAGGSAVTARILAGRGGGNFTVVPFDDGKAVLAALQSGQVQAVIFVGGAPLPNLLSLNANDYKLIPIGEAISSRVAGIYKPATINYTNLKSGVTKTLAASAILLTRKYTLPKIVEVQAKLRSCFYAKLEELQQTPGRHPKWQLVDPTDHGGWEWYELPTPAKPLAPVKTIQR